MIKTIILLGNTVVVVAIAFIQWIDRRAGAPMKIIKEIEKRLDAKAERLARLELQMKDFPKQSEVIRIHERIDGLNNTVNHQLSILKDTVNQQVSGIKDTLAKDARDMSLLLGKIIGQIDQLNLPGKNQ